MAAAQASKEEVQRHAFCRGSAAAQARPVLSTLKEAGRGPCSSCLSQVVQPRLQVVVQAAVALWRRRATATAATTTAAAAADAARAEGLRQRRLLLHGGCLGHLLPRRRHQGLVEVYANLIQHLPQDREQIVTPPPIQ